MQRIRIRLFRLEHYKHGFLQEPKLLGDAERVINSFSVIAGFLACCHITIIICRSPQATSCIPYFSDVEILGAELW